MQVGITGFPRSGKTTVFQALAPGVSPGRDVTFGNIKVPDPRVDNLADHYSPKKTTYAEITFVDIAGNPGATEAKALEAKTIAAMRNVDALVHVVRGYEDPMGMRDINIARDVADFNAELILADFEVVEKRVDRLRRENAKTVERNVLERALEALENETPLRELEFTEDELKAMSGYSLVSLRPVITLFNLGEDEWGDDAYAQWRNPAPPEGAGQAAMSLCGQLEMELADLDEDEQAEFLEVLELEEPARLAFIRKAYELTDLISFLTAGPDECRAWTVRRGSPAPVAAGKIHTDLQRGFIRAEVLGWDHWVEHGSEAAAKAAGDYRVEGKSYIVQDGDILNIRSGV
ncbi:MAG: redox-regulated ATPase YchF [Proteobacteria bacterium]|nr:redox-regulated ATPase YchF [Pseudomonadota bacterium]